MNTILQIIIKLFDCIKYNSTGHWANIFEDYIYISLGKLVYRIKDDVAYYRDFRDYGDLLYLEPDYTELESGKTQDILASKDIKLANIFNNIFVTRVPTIDSYNAISSIMEYLINNRHLMKFSYSAFSDPLPYYSDRNIRMFYNADFPFIIDLDHGLYGIVYNKGIATYINNKILFSTVLAPWALPIPDNTQSNDVLLLVCSKNKLKPGYDRYTIRYDAITLFIKFITNAGISNDFKLDEFKDTEWYYSTMLI